MTETDINGSETDNTDNGDDLLTSDSSATDSGASDPTGADVTSLVDDIDTQGNDGDTTESTDDAAADDAGYPQMKLPAPVAYAHALISGGILGALIIFVFVSLFSVEINPGISDAVIDAIDSETVSSDRLEAILSVLQQHQNSQSLLQLRTLRIVSVFLSATLLLSLGVMLASAVIFGSRDNSGMWGAPSGKGHWMAPALISLTLGGGLLIAALSMDLSSGAITADSDQLKSFVELLQQTPGNE